MTLSSFQFALPGRVIFGRNEARQAPALIRAFGGRGVLVAEGIWPNSKFVDGHGINVLTGDDSPAPFGGAAFHDNRVWLHKSA